MSSLTVYPSLDGIVYKEYGGGLGVTWNEIIAGVGTNVNTASGTGSLVHITADYAAYPDKWRTLVRTIYLFDTSELPDDAEIQSAIFSVHGYQKIDTGGWTPDINVYPSNPASDDELVVADFATIGSTPLCDTPITYANWDASDFNDFTLNADGLAAISKTGLTKLGLRNANYDVAGVEPTWIAAKAGALRGIFIDYPGELYNPKLVITYTALTVTTQDVTEIKPTTALGNGNITDLGSSNPTAHGVCWNETGTPDITDDKTDEGAATETGAFETPMANLVAGTLYYVRAYATNVDGTNYGEEVEFTTPLAIGNRAYIIG